MTGSSRISISRTVERGIKWALLAVFGVGIRRRDPGAVANAVVALAATYVPDALERWFGFEFRPWQRLYAGIAMLTHAVGMLGPYDEQGWWDHITHTLSASLLAGVVHAAARRRGRNPRPRVLAAIAVGGVFWELLEYAVHAISERVGLEPLLVPYSARDTLLDLFFNLVGALLVLAFGDRLLRNLTRRAD